MDQQVRLFGAVAVRPAVLAVISRFETISGCKVAVRWELNPTVRKQIEAGEPFDLVITNPDLIEELTALGKVKAGSQVAFGRIAMGVAAKRRQPTARHWLRGSIQTRLEERRINRLCQ